MRRSLRAARPDRGATGGFRSWRGCPMLDPWLAEKLICPRDGTRLRVDDRRLVCSEGHAYPIVVGIPVMLQEEAEPTQWIAIASLLQARHADAGSELPWRGRYIRAAREAAGLTPYQFAQRFDGCSADQWAMIEREEERPESEQPVSVPEE